MIATITDTQDRRVPTAATAALVALLLALAVPLIGHLPPLPAGVMAAWPWLGLGGAAAVGLGWSRMGDRGPAGGSVALRLAALGAGFALTLLLFGWPLATLWQGGASGGNVVLGWLPQLDAEAYEQGAFALWVEGRLDQFSSRRPIFPGVLAALFAASDGSPHAAQLAFAAASATGAWLAGRAVAASHGGPAGLVVVAALAATAHEHTGAFLTEQVGLPLGCLGFALVWTAARAGPAAGPGGWRRLAMLALGLATIALALNARAGAVFVLPSLCLWIALWQRRSGLRRAGLVFALVVASGLSAFAANGALYRSLGEPGGLPFGNFSYTLYGVVVGHQGWTQVMRDHGDLLAETESEREAHLTIYRLALAAAREDPATALLGVLRTYNEFLIELDWVEMVGPTPARLAAMALLLAGLSAAWARRRQPDGGLMLAATLGILASVPMLADGGARIYAATHAWTAALIAIGFARVLTWRRLHSADGPQVAPQPTATWNGAGLALGGALLAAVVAAGPLAAGRAVPPDAEAPHCAADQVPAVLMARDAPVARIGEGETLPDSLVRDRGTPGPSSRPPTALTRVWNAHRGYMVWLLEPGPEAVTLERLRTQSMTGCLAIEGGARAITEPLTPLDPPAP